MPDHYSQPLLLQVVFEEYGFHSMHSAPAPVFSMRRMCMADPTLPASQAGAGVVLDAGFSFTHVVPFFDGAPLMHVSQAEGMPCMVLPRSVCMGVRMRLAVFVLHRREWHA